MILTEDHLNQFEQIGYMAIMVDGWINGSYRINKMEKKAEALLGKPITDEILNFYKPLAQDVVNICTDYEKNLEQICNNEKDNIYDYDNELTNIDRTLFSYYNYKFNINRKKYFDDDIDHVRDEWYKKIFLNWDDETYNYLHDPYNQKIVKSLLREYASIGQKWVDLEIDT